MVEGVGPLKVLLVDDSTLSRKVQAKVLREVGLEQIIEAKNGLDALNKLKELEFGIDLLLTDWNMPGMDGISLISEVRKVPRGKSLPIIVISSEGEEGKIGQAFAVGASSYVTKPFKKEVLARKIQAVQAIAEIEKKGTGATPAAAAAGGDGAILIEGDLDRLGLGELINFLNYSKKTGELVIEFEGGSAGMSFEDGEVNDAWIGRFATDKAFFAIARLKRGHFKFHEGREPRPKRFTQSTMSLLMEAMRILDEEDADA